MTWIAATLNKNCLINLKVVVLKRCPTGNRKKIFLQREEIKAGI